MAGLDKIVSCCTAQGLGFTVFRGWELAQDLQLQDLWASNVLRLVGALGCGDKATRR